MKQFALIGFSLEHSYSPAIHSHIYKTNNLQANYTLKEIHKKTFQKDIKNLLLKEIHGFNITIPYKTQIIPYLNEITEEAKIIGAVNTVKKKKEKWIGYNTDVFGFLYPLQKFKNKINNCLVLGTGGASRAVIYAVLKFMKPARLTILGRNLINANQLKADFYEIYEGAEINTNKINQFTELSSAADLIVNATSVGMHPGIRDSIIPESFKAKNNVIFYDLIYNPTQTSFLRIAKDNIAGCHTINGIPMLIAQAVKAVEIWTGKKISVEKTIKSLNTAEFITD
jgi:shikimate dehydrogenase